jgi:hypothetical protein
MIMVASASGPKWAKILKKPEGSAETIQDLRQLNKQHTDNMMLLDELHNVRATYLDMLEKYLELEENPVVQRHLPKLKKVAEKLEQAPFEDAKPSSVHFEEAREKLESDIYDLMVVPYIQTITNRFFTNADSELDER